MPIITRKRADKFAIIPNAVAEDENLSFAARGLLCYLLAKPDNWRVEISDIQKTGNIGRDKAYALLKELRQFGYVEIVSKRDKTGQLASHDYLVYDCALIAKMQLSEAEKEPLPENPEEVRPLPENPEVAEPLPDLPDTAEPDTVNPDGLIRTQINNTHFPPYPPKGGEEDFQKKLKQANIRFQKLWQSWPDDKRPDNRSSAFAGFRRLTEAEQSKALDYAADYIRRCLFLKNPPRMINYLRAKLFCELDGAPPIDKDGYFKITPERQEWPLWHESVIGRFGEGAGRTMQSQGYLLVKARWPEVPPQSPQAPQTAPPPTRQQEFLL